MLVNPRFTHNLEMLGILSLIGQGGLPEEVETGIFLSNSFSMGNDIGNDIEKYFDFKIENSHYDSLGSFGVSDNIEQVKEIYKKWLDDPSLNFCISFTKILKSEQSSWGGWRWHKWGKYIGVKKPKKEYLYDEGDDIQEVYCYHIYQLLN